MQEPEKGYTYADYLSWDDGKRYEVIDGVAYDMPPAPSPEHQRMVRRIGRRMDEYLDGGPCEVFLAPFDVRLIADERDDSVVQPDLTVVCDASKIDAQGCKGVPDMVVEVLSASTMRYDQTRKRALYQRAGVREYWIVNPQTRTVEALLLQDGAYASTVYEDTVPSTVLDGFVLQLSQVFRRKGPERAVPVEEA